jgi:hypothetical protein
MEAAVEKPTPTMVFNYGSNSI